jgi:DNA-binding NarL/FixJ family response regulator
MTAVSILLVDDHPVVREGYRRLLERQAGFRVSAEAEDAAAAYRAYQAERPDVVVMDLSLPGPAGWKRSGISGNGIAPRACWYSPCMRAPRSR